MAQKAIKKISWWQVALILLVPLAVLFHPSLRSESILFSNDGPLGIISSEGGALPGAFTGYWDDLNWVGEEHPSALPDFSMLLGLLVNSAVTYSKVYAPLSLLFLGMAGWFLFRRLGFPPLVCLLGAIAFAFNMNAFSNACWGLPSRATTLASILFALGALHLQPTKFRFLRYVLCGFAIGHGIMEGFDVGALYSIVIGLYIGFLALIEKGNKGANLIQGALGLVVVVVAAGVFSAQALSTLIGTQVQGVANMGQDAESRERRWNEATQWSLPVTEVLRVGIPGLFGYRMTDLGGQFQESSYWGGVGRTEGWEEHKQGLARHSGSGEYAGVLVLLLAAFAFINSLRGEQSPFSEKNRLIIWFWSGVAVVSLLLALGKHGPLYRLVYELPYFSMIRNPIKFMHLVHLAFVILFGYGAQLLWSQYLFRNSDRQSSLGAFLKTWWAKSHGFERKWAFGCSVLVIVGVLFWLVYASSRSEMIRVLTASAIPADYASLIHSFSVTEVFWTVGFLIVSVILVTLIVSGAMNRRHSLALGGALVLLLIFDLGRANRFWIVYYDYESKYASNPILEILREKPYERRVSSTLNPFAPSSLSNEQGAFFGVIANSWLQHQFPYYDVASLDVVQMPRPHEMDLAFGGMFVPQSVQEGYKYTRLWELTSTRYLLGMTGYVAVLDQQFDHGRGRFSIKSRFNFVPKSGDASQGVRVDDLTAQEDPEGSFGIIEFHGALPKVKRYAQWSTITNEIAALNRVADLQFDPTQEVVVMDPLGGSSPAEVVGESGTAEIEAYHPKSIRVRTDGAEKGILLLNDRYHPHWNVYVDGSAAPLLRCNFIMRGVAVPPGEHIVEFRFEPPLMGLGISLSSIGIGAFICGYLGLAARRRKNDQEVAPSDSES